jgi:hypothetical protein
MVAGYFPPVKTSVNLSKKAKGASNDAEKGIKKIPEIFLRFRNESYCKLRILPKPLRRGFEHDQKHASY